MEKENPKLEPSTSDKKLTPIIEPELSYKIVGILFEVHSVLDHGHHERYYQRACEIEFKKEGIKYVREFKVDFDYKGKSLGKYFIDFVIEDKIVLELKVVEELTKVEIGQVLRYLRKTNKQLGILANFGKSSLEYKRILNNEYKR